MTRRSARVAAAGGAILALGLLLAAPAPLLPRAAAETGVTGTTIRIGIHAPITGAAAFPQNAFDKGKDVYWKYIAEKGGIFGRNVDVVLRDDQSNQSAALQACGDLVQNQQVFILLGMGVASSAEMTTCAAEVVYLLTSPVNFIKLAQNANNQAYNPIYMGPGISSGLNIVAEAGCPAIGAAKFFSPFPGLDVIDNLDPAYKTSYQKYNGSVPPADDVGLAEGGLAKPIGAVLQATGPDLAR